MHPMHQEEEILEAALMAKTGILKRIKSLNQSKASFHANLRNIEEAKSV
jgi:hypothetical protein